MKFFNLGIMTTLQANTARQIIPEDEFWSTALTRTYYFVYNKT